MQAGNIFQRLPSNLAEEAFDEIVRSPGARIERIVSQGHVSPDTGWYDQHENEWVMLLRGAAVLEFEDGSSRRLAVGDYLNIPARCRHKVSWTSPDEVTVWLAVFYR